MDPTIILIGCGKMGMSLLNGWIDNNHDKKNIIVIETDNKICEVLNNKGVKNYKDLSLIQIKNKNLIFVFAIKPQIINEILTNFTKLQFSNAIFLSIVAGIKIDYIARYLGKEKSIFRAMPNIASEVGEGMTAIYKNEFCHKKDSFYIEKLLSSVGESVWLDSEGDIDIVTAMSGSGPAYFFYITECLINVGCEMGLSQELAEKLAIQTLIGSSKLLELKKTNPEILRKNVTSKGGTTEAALNILKEGDVFKKIFKKAVLAAKNRSEQLSEK